MLRRSSLPLVLAVATLAFYATPTQGRPGDLDASFGSGGRVLAPSVGGGGGFGADGRDLVRTRDGGFALTANAYGIDSTTVLLARYRADGSIDRSFATAGVAVVADSFGLGGSLIEQPDGKLVVAAASPGRRLMLVRFNADGTLD